jgi:hypothetical protein
MARIRSANPQRHSHGSSTVGPYAPAYYGRKAPTILRPTAKGKEGLIAGSASEESMA